MSSLVFLGLSMIAFLISFGLVWILVPMVLGLFFSTVSSSGLLTHMSTAWQSVYNTQQSNLMYIIPLSATVGLFVFVLKVLMVASNKGSD